MPLPCTPAERRRLALIASKCCTPACPHDAPAPDHHAKAMLVGLDMIHAAMNRPAPECATFIGNELYNRPLNDAARRMIGGAE